MNRSVCAAALCILVCVLAFGQQKEAPAPTIKRRTELVLVPAVVTQDGKPVLGLAAKDFVLLHNGQPESVDVFEAIDATSAKVEPVPLPPHTVQNFATANGRQDVVILFFDYLNSSWFTRARVQTYVNDIVRQFVAARTPVSVFVLSYKGLIQLHSFTTDLGNLTKAIERWQSGAPAEKETFANWASPFDTTGNAQADAALSALNARQLDPPAFLAERAREKAEMTVDAIQQISEAFRGVPGRKKLIWISTGFPVVAADTFTDPSTTRRLLEWKIAGKQMRAWKSLSSANISVYPIDSNGVSNPDWEEQYTPLHSGSSQLARYTSTEIPTNTASLLEVAEKTGGTNCTDLPTKCVQRALADGLHYYVLGFYLHGDQKPGWHKLKVNVMQSKAGVRSREGFMVGLEPGEQPVRDKDEVATALASPLDYTSVPLLLNWSALPTQSKEIRVELALFSPPGGVTVDPEDSRLHLDFLAFIRPIGKMEGKAYTFTLANKLNPKELNTLYMSGFRFREQVALAPGRYEARVLLRDNFARKMGTVSTLIDVSAAPAPKKSKP